MTVRSVGVEEELLLVDPETGQPSAVAGSVLRAAEEAKAEEPATEEAGAKANHGRGTGTDDAAAADDSGQALDFELQLQQLETNTPPCRTLDDLGRELRRWRARAAEAAGRAGVRVAALGTSPLPVEPEVADADRYREIVRMFGLTGSEQLTCGCHVHVEINSVDEGVAALDRVGPWLAILLGLSANSPFWQGQDSSYASFRYQVWGRWPSAGPTETFGSAAAYRETVKRMVHTGTLLDAGMVYFDARLSEHYPTLEIRIADVCLRVDDAVLIAALARALVETEARRWRTGKPASRPRAELLRMAAWRASRSGLDDTLLHPVTFLPKPAAAVAELLLDHVREALTDAGDIGPVSELLTALLARGNGAAFQRETFGASGRLTDVVSRAAALTVR